MKKKKRIAILVVLGLVTAFAVYGKFSFQGAPVWLPSSPIVAYRITGNETDMRLFANDPDTIHGYAIVQSQLIGDPKLQKDIVELLNSRMIYGMEGAKCFEPGIALRLGEGNTAIEVLICLGCQHVYFYQGEKVAYRDLNSIGISRIKNLYSQLFPGHTADSTDENANRIADARAKEREKREAVLYSTTSTSQSASDPVQ